MNKEQIIDKAYENYEKSYEMGKHLEGTGLLWMVKETKGTFIYRSKTDSEFSETWGLKIEERELSREERIDLYAKEYTPGMRNKYEPPFDDFIDAKLSVRNIPTKLITITYKDTIIESYE